MRRVKKFLRCCILEYLSAFGDVLITLTTYGADRRRIGRTFSWVTALDGLTFRVEEGQFYSLLGRNGAGKTTAIKILCTLLLADSGTARVGGKDVVADAVAVRRDIGVSIRGERSVYWRLTGRRNLEYFGRLYDLTGISCDDAPRRSVSW